MKKTNQDLSDRSTQALSASFRDPAGFIYRDAKGVLLRQINTAGADDYELFKSSGLYDKLVERNLIVSHKEVKAASATPDAHRTIKPEPIPFISYPFEWSFSQYKDSALLTLKIQRLALKHGMTLKDATAYNVQFLRGKPVFIDTLSFEKYEPGTPWQAYRQFCQHFLAPLSLMAFTDIRLSQLMRTYLDGIPLDLASTLLPRRARIKPGIAMHVILHARAQKSKESTHQKPARAVSKQQLEAIIASLERSVTKLRPHKADTEWGDYYHNTNYTKKAADTKAKLVRELASNLKGATAIDLGGNDGTYSRVLADLGMDTVCTDIDPVAVESNYLTVRNKKEANMLPLLVDLTNPGGGIGWHNDERPVVHERLQADVVMALAIIHHLAISNNLPLQHIAKYFSQFGPHLIIEFVPKGDSQVDKLLATREDIFPDYHEEGFKNAFKRYYKLEKELPIKGTKRTLYLLKRIL